MPTQTRPRSLARGQGEPHILTDERDDRASVVGVGETDLSHQGHSVKWHTSHYEAT